MRVMIVILMLNCIVIAQEPNDNILTPHYFPDQAFLATLIDIYGDFLTVSQAAEQTTLNVSYSGITDLTGLRFFTKMKYLDVGFNQLTELNEIGYLPYLETLHAWVNQLTTLPNFIDHPQLRLLNVNNNQLTSQALEDANFHLLINAREIRLRNNSLTYLPNFRYLKNLADLDVANNNITDISGLKDNPNLLTRGWHILELSGNSLIPTEENCATIALYSQRAYQVEDEGICPYFKYQRYFGTDDGNKLCDTPYTIHDSHFYNTIRFTLDPDTNGDNFFCRHELAGIESLDFPNLYLKNLAGIELFPDLVSVNLGDNNIETLAPLLENQNFVNNGVYLNVENNLLGLDYPTRCELQTLGWTLDQQRNDVDWVEDPCAGAFEDMPTE